MNGASWNGQRLRLAWVVVAMTVLPIVVAPARGQDRTQGRSMVLTREGIVAAESPLAAQAGATILARGGNAVDAAVATNAVMGVVEPMMNGIGGDLFAIVYEAKTGKLYGLNASGWAPAKLSIEFLKAKGISGKMPDRRHSIRDRAWSGGWMVTAALAIGDEEILGSAGAGDSTTRTKGFPCRSGMRLTGAHAEALLKTDANAAATFLIDGRAPRLGEVFRNPDLARSLESIAGRRARWILQRRDCADALWRRRVEAGRRDVGRGFGGVLERMGGTYLDNVSRLDRLRNSAERAGNRGADDVEHHGDDFRSRSTDIIRRMRCTR